ncbi:MAG: hypothetical protein AB7R89_15110 [Dehalococcoidia bacterium]
MDNPIREGGFGRPPTPASTTPTHTCPRCAGLRYAIVERDDEIRSLREALAATRLRVMLLNRLRPVRRCRARQVRP